MSEMADQLVNLKLRAKDSGKLKVLDVKRSLDQSGLTSGFYSSDLSLSENENSKHSLHKTSGNNLRSKNSESSSSQSQQESQSVPCFDST